MVRVHYDLEVIKDDLAILEEIYWDVIERVKIVDHL